MSRWPRVANMTATKWLAFVAVIAVVAAVAIWALLAMPQRAADAPRGQVRPTNAMPGMDMNAMSSGPAAITLSPEQIRAFGITFGAVEERTLDDEVRTVGMINFDETRMAGVTPKFSGYVERLHVDFTGRRVRRGEPLVDIYSPELVAAQEELLLAARLDGSLSQTNVPGVPTGTSNLVAAARQRLRLWDISDAQIDQILRAGRARRTLTLHAPVSGIVVEKNVLAGQAVQAGQPLYTIADLSQVWIEAELREADAALIREGDAATIEVAALPGRLITGRIEYVYPTLQQQARTLKARIAVANPEGRLKPGMFATVQLRAPRRVALAVPRSALLSTGTRHVVFVDMLHGRIMPQQIEIGRVAGDYVEVLAGLEPGQRVVTSAQYLLDSESNLAEVMKSMMSMMNMSDMDAMDMGGMNMPMPQPKKE